MISIIQGDTQFSEQLAELGAKSFWESHGHSGPPEDILAYVADKFNSSAFVNELSTMDSIFKLAFWNDTLIGYSKIIPNLPNPNLAETAVCKLERLYVLQDYFFTGAGKILFDTAVKDSLHLKQKGMWLYVWTGNARALRFYEKNGFRNIGETIFKISENHSNPNFWLYKEF
jgi:ribosomal protein S18 acetylase RimI-like enzyme